MNSKGRIFVVSAPSGTGKTTIIKHLLKELPDLKFSVSATTRKKRENEIDGVDYFFITEEEFLEKIKHNEFIEWQKVYDYYYGTFKKSLDDNINSGKDIILEVDVLGALNIKKYYPSAVLIFLLPPNFEELVNRLKNRKTESNEDLNKRIERAKMELSHKDKFDYLVINENLKDAILSVKNILLKIKEEV
ncbi:MAG: guanylate kinase [Ignavibacterium sp.]